jgi:hypothetical protein
VGLGVVSVSLLEIRLCVRFASSRELNRWDSSSISARRTARAAGDKLFDLEAERPCGAIRLLISDVFAASAARADVTTSSTSCADGTSRLPDTKRGLAEAFGGPTGVGTGKLRNSAGIAV